MELITDIRAALGKVLPGMVTGKSSLLGAAVPSRIPLSGDQPN
jgi:hypothetical protein